MLDEFAIFINNALDKVIAALSFWAPTLQEIGNSLNMNLDTYQNTYGATMGNQTMSTISFNVFTAQWVEVLGNIVCQASAFVSYSATFLQVIACLLS